MKKRENQTIYSLATPPGVSAIAIIRISGPLALDVPKYFFCKKVRSNKVNFRRLKDKDGSIIDEVMSLRNPILIFPELIYIQKLLFLIKTYKKYKKVKISKNIFE